MSKIGQKKYQVIYADPPWNYGAMKPRRKLYRGGNPSAHYPTMSIDEIYQIPVEAISDENAALFLWVTNPKMKIGFNVLDKWGFKYQTTITWVKINSAGNFIRNGLGFYFRGATEHILFGTKGRFIIPTNKRLPNVFMAQRTNHSEKPMIVYDIIESISQGNRIELFARERHLGWDCWGNEVISDIDFGVINYG